MKILGRPLWVTLTALACLSPLALYPVLMGRLPADMAFFVKLYPVYAVATAWLAWLCWLRRPVMFWILLALLLLTHAAMWLPVLLNNNPNIK